MVKIGEGGGLPEKPGSVNTLQESIAHFENAVSGFSVAGDREEREQLTAIMDQQMGLIKAAIQQIRLSNVQAQGEKVSSDYDEFKSNPSEANQDRLFEDLSILKQQSLLSKGDQG